MQHYKHVNILSLQSSLWIKRRRKIEIQFCWLPSAGETKGESQCEWSCSRFFFSWRTSRNTTKEKDDWPGIFFLCTVESFAVTDGWGKRVIILLSPDFFFFFSMSTMNLDHIFFYFLISVENMREPLYIIGLVYSHGIRMRKKGKENLALLFFLLLLLLCFPGKKFEWWYQEEIPTLDQIQSS